LSSNWTFFYKSMFPILFIGFQILFSAVLLLTAARSGNSRQLPFITIPIIMGVIFYFTMTSWFSTSPTKWWIWVTRCSSRTAIRKTTSRCPI
jgi:hypothetical protein